MNEISVIIPAFNEAQDIGRNLNSVESRLKSIGTTYEILIVNDGSTDNTLEVIKPLASSHVHIVTYPSNQGKGFAVRLGVEKAQGKYILFIDADLSTSLESIDQFLKIMREGKYDILIGERKSTLHLQQVKQPFHRRLLGTTFIWLSQICVEKNIKDFNCGFKMFTREAAAIVFPKQRTIQWAFDTEILGIAVYYKLRIGEIPVIWNHHQSSHVRALRDVVTSFRDLCKIKYGLLVGHYKA